MFTDDKGKVRPLWAAVFSLLLSALAFFVCGNIAHEAAEQHPFRVEFIFRPLWALLLMGQMHTSDGSDRDFRSIAIRKDQAPSSSASRRTNAAALADQFKRRVKER